MRTIHISKLKPAAQKLIAETRENSVNDSSLYRCERSDGHIYIAALENGRALEFVEVLMCRFCHCYGLRPE